MESLYHLLHRIFNDSVWYLGVVLSRMARPYRAKSLAIIRIDGIGDFILFMPALQYIREKFKDYKITLVLQDRVSQLAEGCPYIDEILTFKAKKYRWNLLYKLVFNRKLSKAGFEISLYPAYSREQIGDQMVLWTGAPQKIAWNSEAINMTSREKIRGDRIYTRLFRSNATAKHELQRNREFLKHLGIQANNFKPEFWITEDDRKKAEHLLPQNVVDSRHLIAIFPGALSEQRKWGMAKFNLLMERVAAIDKKAFFIFVGGAGESAGLRLEKRSGESSCLDLCGKTTLRELPLLFARCKAVVGNETGPLHLAMGAGVPTVCILGGGHFGRFAPYGDPQRNRFVYRKMNCFNCNWRCVYPFPRCISSITVEEVFSELSICLRS